MSNWLGSAAKNGKMSGMWKSVKTWLWYLAFFSLVAFVFAAYSFSQSADTFAGKVDVASALLERHPEFGNMTVRQALEIVKAYPVRYELSLKAACAGVM